MSISDKEISEITRSLTFIWSVFNLSSEELVLLPSILLVGVIVRFYRGVRGCSFTIKAFEVPSPCRCTYIVEISLAHLTLTFKRFKNEVGLDLTCLVISLFHLC